VTQLNTPTRLPSPLGSERVVSVSAGENHSLALTADGAVWSWGDGAYGRLGHGDQQNQLLPKKIEALACHSVVAVSAGGAHSLALTAGGRVWSWGWAYFGQLGHGDNEEQLLPRKVEALAGQRIIAVSAGESHSLAITADGSMWSWGLVRWGLLGYGEEQRQPLPKKVEAFTGQRVVAVSAGFVHSLAITADGALWSWGRGGYELGHGDQQNRLLPKKIVAFAGQRVVAAAPGHSHHSLALTADGVVWSWGRGHAGVLGHGDEQDQLLPKKVEALAGQRVVAVSAGGDHGIALTVDGAVFAWGEGRYGCLGHGEDLSNKLLPKKVEAWASRPPTPASSGGEDHSDGEDSDLDG
jgi:alpha-tubulin suppressor-like RCC1 family protein